MTAPSRSRTIGTLALRCAEMRTRGSSRVSICTWPRTRVHSRQDPISWSTEGTRVFEALIVCYMDTKEPSSTMNIRKYKKKKLQRNNAPHEGSGHECGCFTSSCTVGPEWTLTVLPKLSFVTLWLDRGENASLVGLTGDRGWMASSSSSTRVFRIDMPQVMFLRITGRLLPEAYGADDCLDPAVVPQALGRMDTQTGRSVGRQASWRQSLSGNNDLEVFIGLT